MRKHRCCRRPRQQPNQQPRRASALGAVRLTDVVSHQVHANRSGIALLRSDRVIRDERFGRLRSSSCRWKRRLGLRLSKGRVPGHILCDGGGADYVDRPVEHDPLCIKRRRNVRIRRRRVDLQFNMSHGHGSTRKSPVALSLRRVVAWKGQACLQRQRVHGRHERRSHQSSPAYPSLLWDRPSNLLTVAAAETCRRSTERRRGRCCSIR
jgi:hypothetical protein